MLMVHILLDTTFHLGTVKSATLVKWNPPPTQVTKINTDESSLGDPGVLGFDGILQDKFGNWITGFMGYCGFTINMTTKLFGILNGLKIAKAGDFCTGICEMDSQIALQMISQGVPLQNQHAPIIFSIRSFLDHDWDLTFKHTHREGNACANWLAKSGANSQDHFRLLNFCPV